VIPADQFYVATGGPPKQGDLLFAGVVRLVAEDRFTPPAWSRLDLYDATIEIADGISALRLVTGPALVMVTSHDCHFDKEWNQRRRALIRAGHADDEAERIASADPTLDRAFNASPLLRPEEVGRDRRALLDGKVLGYLPVPASPDGVVPEAVVDLTYRVTLDRLDLDVHRVTSVSEAARAQLRYALAQLDSLRVTKVGFEIEHAVGRRINDVSVPRGHPLFVRLHLDDGTNIDLLQHPDEPGRGPAREAWSGPAA
jgi:hypothetical protein